MSDPERLKNPENSVESSEAAKQQLEKLSNSPENSVELSPRDAEVLAERARTEALESAISVEAGGAEKSQDKPTSKVSRKRSISKQHKEESFKKQMKDVRSQMPPVSKAFSKVVHNKVIEKTSEVVGSTVARPNAILAGAFTSFILTLIVYVVAKNVGYKLSGFETIAAFAIGWLIGILYDYLRIIITGKK